MTKVSRRHFICTVGTAAGTVLTHACSATRSNSRLIARSVSSADQPEVTQTRLGFLATTDAAPLILAKEKGYFDKYGMVGVELVRQDSWGEIERNLIQGSKSGGLDGAHIPTSIPYLMTAGKTELGVRTPMYILARLNVNGQAISLANIYEHLNIRRDSTAFKDSVEEAKKAGPGMRLKIAVTFPGSTDDLWMRYWLAAGDIDPDKDVTMLVVPPSQMVANMETGTIHGLCVGEPWNSQIVRKNIGYSPLITSQLWSDHAEKSFAMRADWVNKYPKATRALLMAVLEAQIWCDHQANVDQMCRILSVGEYINAPVEDILSRAKDTFNLGDGQIIKDGSYRIKFWANHASYPYKNHDLWFLTESIRWGYLPSNISLDYLVNKVNREDLWRKAAREIGQSSATPTSTSRGVETFLDGREFNAKNPLDYLELQPIRKRS